MQRIYEIDQINKLEQTIYGYNIQIRDGKLNKTNYININDKQLEQIKAILLK